MFLLTIALRVFTLMEFVVQRQLQEQPQGLRGLYDGNPKRATHRPTAERLLAAFCNITLYHYRDGTFEITPLDDLQKNILSLMAVPQSVYNLTTGVPPELRFDDRNRRPPKDRFNALLSFGYALLIKDVMTGNWRRC